MSRRAKIVCTIGPATASLDTIRGLVRAGMDVARLNLGYGSHADHARVYSLIRQASDEAGRAVGIVVDLPGPAMRLGRFSVGPVHWDVGDEVRVTVVDVAGTHDRVSVTYPGLAQDAREGDRLLVDDGNVVLVVRKVEDVDVVCDVRSLRVAWSAITKRCACRAGTSRRRRCQPRTSPIWNSRCGCGWI